MKFIVVGLGSMGKRRIRCLKALGYNDITGFDLRKDRCDEAKEKYGINVVEKLENVDFKKYNALIISTPPDKHLDYINLAVGYSKPAFIEASVILKGLEEINQKAKEKKVLITPSATMLFHPVIKDIKEIIEQGALGKITNFSYHSGQYLPDWHPWEDIRDFYVSKRETGGAREIVPFELTWLTKILGYPKNIKGFFGKTMDLGVDIDDTYAVAIEFNSFFGVMVVDVVSRFAIRKLVINLEYGQISWDWNDGFFKVYDAKKNRSVIYYQPESIAQYGYNKNIIEEMYIKELKAFIDTVNGEERFPNTLDEDISVLKLLQDIEGGTLP